MRTIKFPDSQDKTKKLINITENRAETRRRLPWDDKNESTRLLYNLLLWNLLGIAVDLHVNFSHINSLTLNPKKYFIFFVSQFSARSKLILIISSTVPLYYFLNQQMEKSNLIATWGNTTGIFFCRHFLESWATQPFTLLSKKKSWNIIFGLRFIVFTSSHLILLTYWREYVNMT